MKKIRSGTFFAHGKFFARRERQRQVFHEKIAAERGAVAGRHVVHEKIGRPPANVAEFIRRLGDKHFRLHRHRLVQLEQTVLANAPDVLLVACFKRDGASVTVGRRFQRGSFNAGRKFVRI